MFWYSCSPEGKARIAEVMSFQDEYEKERELHRQRWEIKKKKQKWVTQKARNRQGRGHNEKQENRLGRCMFRDMPNMFRLRDILRHGHREKGTYTYSYYVNIIYIYYIVYYIYIYMYMCVCIYIHTYIYIYIHIHIYTACFFCARANSDLYVLSSILRSSSLLQGVHVVHTHTSYVYIHTGTRAPPRMHQNGNVPQKVWVWWWEVG